MFVYLYVLNLFSGTSIMTDNEPNPTVICIDANVSVPPAPHVKPEETDGSRYTGVDSMRCIAQCCFILINIQKLVMGIQENNVMLQLIHSDLNSLCFIISGFAVMSSCSKNDDSHLTDKESIKHFIWRRFRSTYPLYLLTCIYYLVYKTCQGQLPNCLYAYICYIGNILNISPWSLCNNVGSNIQGPGWYISILFSLWLIFAFIQNFCFKVCRENPWMIISVLGFTSNSVYFLYFFSTNIIDWHEFPVFRLSEFLLGTVLVHTIKQPIHCLWAVVVSIVLITFYILYSWTGAIGDCNVGRVYTACKVYPSISKPCWNELLFAKTAFLYAVLVHFVVTRNWLDWKICKVLNQSHLQVYLLHQPIAEMTLLLSGYMQCKEIWNPFLLVIWVYCVAHLFMLYIQPWLDYCPIGVCRLIERSTNGQR